MSRVAKNPIDIPSGVKVDLNEDSISVKGPKGELTAKLHALVNVLIDNNQLRVKAANESKFSRALSGTIRSNLNNIVIGVSEGFKVELSVIGVGYRVQIQGKKLIINAGLSHKVEFPLPEGVSAETPKPTIIILSGCDKQLVSLVASKIREIRPPENYKGKGIRYVDEVIVLKETKKK